MTESILIQLSEETRALYDLQAASLGRSLEDHLSALLESHLDPALEPQSEPVKPEAAEVFKPKISEYYAGARNQEDPVDWLDKRNEQRRADAAEISRLTREQRKSREELSQPDIAAITRQSIKSWLADEAKRGQEAHEASQKAEAEKAKQADDLKAQMKALQHAANEAMRGIG
jgi:hypothetical protein